MQHHTPASTLHHFSNVQRNKNANTFKLMVIAGEASGDRIAARAITQVQEIAARSGYELECYGIGGDECKRAGLREYHHAKEMSVVGFVEVAKRFSFFRKVMQEMTSLLTDAETRPDTLLLIDYPGFNIRLAKIAKKLGVRIVYYVSPQVWAWHKERVHELKALVDEMLVIFPFEESIYRNAGLEKSYFIGHPLVEMIDEEKQQFSERNVFAEKYHLDATREWLLVFSGSRREEVRRLLPTMSQAAIALSKKYNMQAVLVEAPTIEPALYSDHTIGCGMKRFRAPEANHELMYHAKAGILKSGTTTLEAALLGLPGVICYKTHPITFAIGKRVVKLPYIGLANIVKGSKLYPELLQEECTEEKIVEEISLILEKEAQFRSELENLAETLRHGDVPPSVIAAEHILAATPHPGKINEREAA